MTEIDLGAIGRLVTEQRGTFVLARLEGEVDISNEDDLSRALREAVPADGDGLVIDLGPTAYIDSSGIRALFALHHHLHQRRQSLRLVLPPASPLHEVLEISGVTSAIDVRGDVEGALR